MNVDILRLRERRPQRSVSIDRISHFRLGCTTSGSGDGGGEEESVLDALGLVRAVQPHPGGEVLPQGLEHLLCVVAVASLNKGLHLNGEKI